MTYIRSLIFFMSVLHLGIVFIGLVLFPFLPWKWVSGEVAFFFYFNICLYGLPLAVLATLIWSIRLEFSFLFNLTVIFITCLIAYGTFIFLSIVLGLLGILRLGDFLG